MSSGVKDLKSASLNNVNRPLMCFHPARIVLLDISCPFEYQAGRYLCDALEHTLCLSANLAGPSRIPLLGIYVMGTSLQCMLPLTGTKSNFVHLYAALTNVRTYLDESLQQHQERGVQSSIAQVMLEACSEYKRYVEHLSQGAVNFKQLELILFTGHQGDFVHRQIEPFSAQIDYSILKRIVSVTVRCSLLTSDTQDSPDVPMFDAVCDELTGLIDTVTLECDPLSHQKFFYGWLINSSTESEQVHLLLPPPNPTEEELVLKCDIAERMISPTQIPFSEMFDLHEESKVCKHVFPTSSKAIGMTVPIQQLKAVQCISRDAVCESVLFGLPLILLPTTCWKMDWDVLERNQQNFVSLAGELFSKNLILLAQLLPPPAPKVPDNPPAGRWSASKGSTGTPLSAPKPSGCFMVIASGHRTLLIKSVLPRELLLPSPQNFGTGAPVEESDLRVQASLTQVERSSSFNPLHHETGLYAALKHMSLPKSAVDRARTFKRKAGLPQTSTEKELVCHPPDNKYVDKGSRKTVNAWVTSVPGNIRLQ